MLDSEHENPELIWNNDTRERVARVVAEECNKLYAKQKVRDNLYEASGHFVTFLEGVFERHFLRYIGCIFIY